MKKILATFAVLSAASFAIAQDADLTESVVAGSGTAALVDGAPQGATETVDIAGTLYDVYDFAVSSPNDWSNTTEVFITVTGSSFRYATGVTPGSAPLPFQVGVDPSAAAHTFLAGPNTYPNTANQFAGPLSTTPGGTWGATEVTNVGGFDTENDGAFDIVAMRIVVESTADYTIQVDGNYFTSASQGVPSPFSHTIIVPEPSALALLALGGLAGLIRRR